MGPSVPRGALLAVLALSALGAVLRLRPADFGLPHRLHYDEKHTLDELDLLRSDPEVARADPRFGIYPLLVPRLARLIAPREPAPAPGPLEGHLRAASRDLWLMRSIAAALALLAVPGTWLLARRFVDGRAALLAAALMAVSLLHVWYSNHARPHGPASGLVVLAVVGALAVRRRGDAASYLFTGLAAALAVGCSQAALGVVPCLALAHLLRPRSASRLAWLWLACAGAIVLLGAWLFCPSWFGSRGELAPVALDAAAFSGAGLGRLARGLWHFEPHLVSIAIAGAIGGAIAWTIARLARGPGPPQRAEVVLVDGGFLRRRLAGREDLAIVLVHAAPYAAVLALYSGTSQRYFLLLLPYFLVFVAWVATRAPAWLASKVACGRWSTALALVPPLALAGVETGLAVKASLVCVAPDTAARAAQWIGNALDPRSARLAVIPGLDLPLLREPAALASHGYHIGKQTPWARYQSALGAAERGATTWSLSTLPLETPEDFRLALEQPRAWLARVRAEYVVVELTDRAIPAGIIASVRSVGTRVARFSPMQVDRGDDTPFLWWDQQNEYEEGASWLVRLLQARSLGGVVEVYRVERPTQR